MINIEFDLKPFDKELEKMVQTIAETQAAHMPNELWDWQIDDLNRNKPNNNQLSAETVFTRLWSRVAIGRRQTSYRKYSAKSRLKAPILRPSMYEKLYERMGVMLQVKIRWQ